MEECPVFIEHVPTIMDMRRFMVMEQSKMPETAQQTLQQLEQRGHPWRGTQLTRTTWIEEMAAEGVDVPMFDGSQEYLYWVGCTGALQERNVKVTKSLVRLLLEAGVSFGVLGGEEGCSGDPARRLGKEYLYQLQAEQNIEIFKAKSVQKVIANCPHCYNTIAHEYPQFDGKFETIHHSVFLAQLIEQGKLRPDATNGLSEKIRHLPRPLLHLPPQQHHRRAALGPRRHRHAARSRWGAASAAPSAAAPAARTCGSRRAAAAHQRRPHDGGRRHRRRPHRRRLPLLHADVRVARRQRARRRSSAGVQVFDLAELLEKSVAFSRPSGNGGAPPAPEPHRPRRRSRGEGGGGGDADGLGASLSVPAPLAGINIHSW